MLVSATEMLKKAKAGQSGVDKVHSSYRTGIKEPCNPWCI